MLSSENLYSVKFFDYDATNRMALSTVTDLIEHSYTATTYAYDALGRRTLTQTEGHTAERTLYDGMSFEVLRQGTADSNGRFVSTDVAKGRFNYGYGFPFNSYTTYNSSGNWIFDMFFGGMWGFGAGAHGSNNGQEADPEYYDIENLYPLYGNGEAVATYEEDLVYSPHETFWNNWGGFYSGLFGTRESYYSTYSETNYFATDLLGSVKVTTNARGEVSGKTSYDVFGSLYGSNGTLAESSLMFAYTGKTWNDITELSNYGFRDYSPQIARFTTVDPIRDGSNWYAYVHNDPVNLRDLWGLCSESDQNLKVYDTSMIPDNYPVGPYVGYNWSNISSSYGYRTDPVYGTENTYHSGIDYHVPVGTEVLSTKAGTVTSVLDNDPIYGNAVFIDHGNGYETLTAHLSEVYVKEGQEVPKAAVIGLSGGAAGAYGSGKSTGPHVHFAVYKTNEEGIKESQNPEVSWFAEEPYVIQEGNKVL